MTDERDLITGTPLVRWRAAASICNRPVQEIAQVLAGIPRATDTPAWMQGGLTNHDNMVVHRRVFAVALGDHLETKDPTLMILQQGTRPLMSTALVPRAKGVSMPGRMPKITPGEVRSGVMQITWKPMFGNVLMIASVRHFAAKPAITVVIWSATA